MPRAQCDAIVRTRLPSVCDIQYNICIFIEMNFSESNWKIQNSNGKYDVMKSTEHMCESESVMFAYGCGADGAVGLFSYVIFFCFGKEQAKLEIMFLFKCFVYEI